MFNQAFHLISFYNENKANPKISLSYHKARMIHAAVFFFEKEFLLAPVEHLNIFFHDNKFFFSLAARSDFISKIKIFKAPTEDSFVLVFSLAYETVEVLRRYSRFPATFLCADAERDKEKEKLARQTSSGCKYLSEARLNHRIRLLRVIELAHGFET